MEERSGWEDSPRAHGMSTAAETVALLHGIIKAAQRQQLSPCCLFSPRPRSSFGTRSEPRFAQKVPYFVPSDPRPGTAVGART